MVHLSFCNKLNKFRSRFGYGEHYASYVSNILDRCTKTTYQFCFEAEAGKLKPSKMNQVERFYIMTRSIKYYNNNREVTAWRYQWEISETPRHPKHCTARWRWNKGPQLMTHDDFPAARTNTRIAMKRKAAVPLLHPSPGRLLPALLAPGIHHIPTPQLPLISPGQLLSNPYQYSPQLPRHQAPTSHPCANQTLTRTHSKASTRPRVTPSNLQPYPHVDLSPSLMFVFCTLTLSV